MKIQGIILYILAVALLSGCATGKSISKADDIQDDGKSNIVVLTYDVKLYARDKYPTVKATTLSLDCPENSVLNRYNCISLNVPYKGKSEYEGYDLYTFESSGAKVMRMKYNALSVTSGKYKILIDEQTRTKCSYNKKKKKTYCYPVTDKDYDTHQFSLPNTLQITVTPGSGCYMGHLSLVLVDEEVSEYDFALDTELTESKLANLNSGVRNAVLQFVDRPCY